MAGTDLMHDVNDVREIAFTAWSEPRYESISYDSFTFNEWVFDRFIAWYARHFIFCLAPERCDIDQIVALCLADTSAVLTSTKWLQGLTNSIHCFGSFSRKRLRLVIGV
jgi:hypothetical protein